MNKSLICYFSASGVTKMVANKIKNVINSDIFEIEPVEKYTDDDLDWRNENSRSSLEMKDRSSRPKIKNKISNIDEYNKIILGFPVWWDVAPTIINTFIEENDLNNKDIYVFVTSGESSSSNSFQDLKNSYENLNFVKSIRITDNTNSEEINSWLN